MYYSNLYGFLCFNILAFGVEVNAQCSGVVDFLVDNKSFTNATLIKPMDNTGGVIRCSRCNRNGNHIRWFASDGSARPQISPCDNNDMPTPCTKPVGNSTIDLDLVFSTFITGTYKCGGNNNQETIMIEALS